MSGMTVVHSDMHTYEQFLKTSVGLGLGLFVVHLLRFSMLVFWFGLAVLFLCFYIFALRFLSIYLFFFFFSSPNLSGRRLDVYHTSTHGVALVRI